MCEKCLYKKNCQFIAKHKTIVEGCTAFKSEAEIKTEAIKEFAERLKEQLKGTFYEVADTTCKIDNLVKELTEEKGGASDAD